MCTIPDCVSLRGRKCSSCNENSCSLIYKLLSFFSSQGSAELLGVAFCHEYGGGPEQSLQGHQESFPQGTLPRT